MLSTKPLALTEDLHQWRVGQQN